MRRALINSAAVLLLATAALPAIADDIATAVLEKAIARYHAGELQQAIGGINAALRARLQPEQLGRAYYFRGLANRKSGNSGAAITDLTRALEHSGLSDAERSDATENLEFAHREAGLADNEQVVVVPTNPMRSERQPAAATASRPAAQDEPATWVTTGSTLSQQGARWTESNVELSALPPVPLPSGAPSMPAKPKATPSVAALSADTVPAFVTEVSITQDAVLPAPAGTSLIVGEVGSRNEVVSLAVRLTSQRGTEIGPRRPQIETMQLADTAIYRLRLGPYADADRALALCQSLRDSGYSCATE